MMKQTQGETRESLQEHEFRALMAHRLTNSTAGEEGESTDIGSYGMPFEEVPFLLKHHHMNPVVAHHFRAADPRRPRETLETHVLHT